MLPKYTVITNLASPESLNSPPHFRFVGQSWEFFHSREEADICYCRQAGLGNSVVVLRRYHHATDFSHLHRSVREEYLKTINPFIHKV